MGYGLASKTCFVCDNNSPGRIDTLLEWAKHYAVAAKKSKRFFPSVKHAKTTASPGATSAAAASIAGEPRELNKARMATERCPVGLW